jgi:hypothetical protein
MSKAQILFLAALFLAIFCAAAMAMLLFSRDPVKQRLKALDERESVRADTGTTWLERLSRLAQPLAKLSVPAEGWETSPVRLRFINAGWRDAVDARPVPRRENRADARLAADRHTRCCRTVPSAPPAPPFCSSPSAPRAATTCPT